MNAIQNTIFTVEVLSKAWAASYGIQVSTKRGELVEIQDRTHKTQNQITNSLQLCQKKLLIASLK